MDPISFAASVAALVGVLSKTISYLTAVKDASTERKALSQEAAGLLSVLISLQNKVEDHENLESCTEGIRILATEYGPLDQLREALKQLAQRLKPKKKGIKNIAGTLIWPFDKKQCEEIFKKVERVKSRIDLALQGDIHKLVHEIKADTAGIDLVKEQMSDVHIRENMRERNDILTWFSPLNFFQSQQDKFRRRAKDTGQWLIDAPAFQNWVAGSDCTLCCSGIPGAGKSILASVVVDYLRNVFEATYSYGVAAAYCNFKEREMQSAENLLAGLCVQVIDDAKPVPEILGQLYESHASRQTRPTLEDVLDVFREVVKHFKTTYLIVDALDECPSEVRDILLQKLKALQPMIRLLVTTRPTIDQFAENATIEVRASHGDLEKYIHSRVASGSRLSILLQRRTRLLGEVCNKVIDKASGMFLAATLHMDSLATKMSVEKLKRAIENLPSTLNQLYDDAFRRIDDQDEEERGFANKALRWVAYAYRPLTVRELEEALAIEPRGQDFNPDAAPDIAFVLEACAGLLIVDKETEQVRLVHYTAQDYLDTLLTSRYREAHASIAGDCITYLNYDVFQLRQQCNKNSDDEPDDEPDADLDAEPEYDESDDECVVKARNDKKQLTYCLLEYASHFWEKHYRISGQGIKLGAQLHDFLASNPRIRLRARHYEKPPRSPAQLETSNGIGIAAYYGLYVALRRLLQQNEVDIDEKTYEGHSALHLAVMNDEVVSIEILLEYGANIECNGKYVMTPLMLAIRRESIKSAWLLVERGANAMVVHRPQDEPFASVFWASPIPFLQLLLNLGADVNAVGYYHRTQLMWRAGEDDVETARWLLEKGAAVDLRDSDRGRTALFHAAERASVDMVRLLLGHGADSSISDRYGNTILHAACMGGKVALLRQFLNLGIDIDSTNYLGRTPLHLAARNEHCECLELLLANNAGVDKKDRGGRTPLMTAICWRSTKVIHSLLDASARVDLQDRIGCSALHLAVANSDIPVVRLLLKRHANCAERSPLDLSLKHSKNYTFVGPFPVLASSDGQSTFLNAQALCNSGPVYLLKRMLDEREEVLECRLWKGGMTALDIAIVINDAECIDLLEPLTGSRTESTTMSFGDYMCELFGCSSVAELEEEFERRDGYHNFHCGSHSGWKKRW